MRNVIRAPGAVVRQRPGLQQDFSRYAHPHDRPLSPRLKRAQLPTPDTQALE